ncbi:3'-5' exoribonuclease [Escherichia coli]
MALTITIDNKELNPAETLMYAAIATLPDFSVEKLFKVHGSDLLNIIHDQIEPITPEEIEGNEKLFEEIKRGEYYTYHGFMTLFQEDTSHLNEITLRHYLRCAILQLMNHREETHKALAQSFQGTTFEAPYKPLDVVHLFYSIGRCIKSRELVVMEYNDRAIIPLLSKLGIDLVAENKTFSQFIYDTFFAPEPTPRFEGYFDFSAVEKPAFCLDVENLSLEKNGVLLEIGILFFDLANPESVINGPRIDIFPDIYGQIADGGDISESTLEWWQTKAPKEARDYCFQHDGVMDYREAITTVNAFVNNIRDEMTEYYGKDTFYYLARGETDWPQLEHWFRKAGFKPVCRYNQVQDIRSMLAAYQDKPVSILGTKEYPDMGIPLIRHTAIGDAIMDAYDVAKARSMAASKLLK